MFSDSDDNMPQSSQYTDSAEGSSTYDPQQVQPEEQQDFDPEGTALIRHPPGTIPEREQDSDYDETTQIVRVRKDTIPMSQAQKEAIELASGNQQQDLPPQDTAPQADIPSEDGWDDVSYPTHPAFQEGTSQEMLPPLPDQGMRKDVHARPTLDTGSPDPALVDQARPTLDTGSPEPIADVHTRPTLNATTKEELFAQDIADSTGEIPQPAFVAENPYDDSTHDESAIPPRRDTVVTPPPRDTMVTPPPRDTTVSASSLEEAFTGPADTGDTDLSEHAVKLQSESDIDSLFDDDKSDQVQEIGNVFGARRNTDDRMAAISESIQEAIEGRDTQPETDDAFERADTEVMDRPVQRLTQIIESELGEKHTYKRRIRAVGGSDIGMERSVNEDRYFIDVENGIFLIADGMGGHTRGDDAAEATVDLMKNHIIANMKEKQMASEEFKPFDTVTEGTNIAHEAIIDLNGIVDGSEGKKPLKKQMGTTLSSLIFYEDKAYASNVGDSRIYRITKNPITKRSTLKQISEDHTRQAYNLKHAKNRKQREYFKNNPSGTLLQAVGIPPGDSKYMSKDQAERMKLSIAHNEQKSKGGEIYLMCSDGLTDLLTEQEIADIIDNAADIAEAYDDLIAAANDAGGHDNITVILVEVEKDPVNYMRKAVAGMAAAAMITGAIAVDRLAGDQIYEKIGDMFRSQPSIADVASPAPEEKAQELVDDIPMADDSDVVEVAAVPAATAVDIPTEPEAAEFDFDTAEIQEELGMGPAVENADATKMDIPPLPAAPEDTTATAEEQPESLENMVVEMRSKLGMIESETAGDSPASTTEERSVQSRIKRAYHWMVKKVRSDHPKSKIKKYNLSKDAKSTISDQGVINTAYWFGTRTDKDRSNDYRGGPGNKEQRVMAESWLQKHTGHGLDHFIAERGSVFQPTDINAEGLPDGAYEKGKAAPKKVKSKNQKGKNKKAKKQKKTGAFDDSLLDNAPPLEQLMEMEGVKKSTLYAPTDKTPQEYTAVQRTVIEHLYKEFKFAKSITADEMMTKGAEYSIRDLTPELASQVYLDSAMDREDEILLTDVVEDDDMGEEILLIDIVEDDTTDTPTPLEFASEDDPFSQAYIEYCINTGYCAIAVNEAERQWNAGRFDMPRRVAISNEVNDPTRQWNAGRFDMDRRIAEYNAANAPDFEITVDDADFWELKKAA